MSEQSITLIRSGVNGFLSTQSIGTDAIAALYAIPEIKDIEVTNESDDQVDITYSWTGDEKFWDADEHLKKFGLARVSLSEENALRAYAKMLNTLDIKYLEPLLSDDFIYESQHVFQPLESKDQFLDYIQKKLITIQKSKATVFAEMGTVAAYGKNQPCVILAQEYKENLVGLVLAKTKGSKLKRLDICVVPTPRAARRSGEYPK